MSFFLVCQCILVYTVNTKRQKPGSFNPSRFNHFLAAAGPAKQVHLLHSSEYPRTTFAVLDSMKCVVAENSLDTIFAHLKQFYAPRKAQKIEAKGFHYKVKQYVVKFGSIVTGATNRGIVVEVHIVDDIML